MHHMRMRRDALFTFILAGSCAGCLSLLGPMPLSDAEQRGKTLLSSALRTNVGTMQSCASCHGDDATGGIGPDIRAADATHLQAHAQGDAPMPVKYPDLTAADFEDLEAYLSQLCAAAADCTIGADHDHDGGA